MPSIENFFYSITTENNCLPSLHTAMTILVAYCLSLTDNKKFKIFGYFVMITVIISVIYLSIHWITDVIAGALLALGAIFLVNYHHQNQTE
jgi:membrane-associated phospholipid phosphatase